MISVKVLSKQFEKLVVDNAPVILTAVGVVGTVTAAVLTGKATLQASELIDDERERRLLMNEDDLDRKATILLVWMEYLPAAGVCTLTVTSIIFANKISTGRAAALAAAYSLSEKRLGEYRDKVAEKFNPTKEKQVQDEVAQDRVNANPPSNAQVFITGKGDITCYDMQTGRYFKSDVESLRQIENRINQQVNQMGNATLNDMYMEMNMTPTPYSDELGWDTDKLLKFEFSAVLVDDQQPVIAFDYTFEPIRTGMRGDNSEPPF